MNPLILIGNIALLATTPALALLVGFYFFKSPWKKHKIGRRFMAFAVGAILTIGLSQADVFIGHTYPGHDIIRLIAYGYISVTTWMLFISLRELQKQDSGE